MISRPWPRLVETSACETSMHRAAPPLQGTSHNTYRAHSSACREPESPAASPRQPSETHCTAGVWDAALEHPREGVGNITMEDFLVFL